MDCTKGYNQIQMALKDYDAMAFRTPKGIFYYKVMPFHLKIKTFSFKEKSFEY